jgi:hypothetical protein
MPPNRHVPVITAFFPTAPTKMISMAKLSQGPISEGPARVSLKGLLCIAEEISIVTVPLP